MNYPTVLGVLNDPSYQATICLTAHASVEIGALNFTVTAGLLRPFAYGLLDVHAPNCVMFAKQHSHTGQIAEVPISY